ncbi:aldo/keto reductase [Halomicroarcula sp. GCM10025324]|uniref:aldo/keto reductase n=1 Tax=Haloarcula TaxID=2237 RepID=UPI0023E776F0|nr:aldo/keto reductase [Halomicroarcula sp. ZS-22-S1]
MNCLFVGAGSVAHQYADALPGSPLSLAGVCDTDAERAADFGEKHDAAAFTDLERALSTCDADIAVNLTSHTAHATVTRQCLEAGRHVYSEKPLALDGETAADLLAVADRADRGLACAPVTPEADAQRLAGRALADGRLGRVGLVYAHAHVGRVTDWHDRPDAFLSVGPLYDGAVYPLSLLVAWFGPVAEVRVADALDVWPAREDRRPSAPSHVEATLDFADGPVARLTASFYAPHRAREFYGLELHGDDGSLYLEDAGALSADRTSVSFGRVDREYTPMPPQTPGRETVYLDGVERFAAALADGHQPRETARRGAHVVAVCAAIERAAADGGSVSVLDCGATADPVPRPIVRPDPDRHVRHGNAEGDPPGTAAIRLPPVGFGCSRYRGDGEYVDRDESIATALDAGYRLVDVAELYGNEHRIGELLAAPGSPDRETLFLLGKVWNTNHGHVVEACTGSLEELGVDAFDCYALHWPDAWQYQGPLERLAERPTAEAEALTFPTDDRGDRATADLSLTESWAHLETAYERGLTRTLGVCNVSLAQLRTVLDVATVPPALVQVERHPYQPRTDLVQFCHERGIRVVAHSPLSAPGLLDEPVLTDIAAERGRSPAEVVVAWNVSEGVVPIPSSTDADHVVANLAAAGLRLDAAERERIATLEDPSFER